MSPLHRLAAAVGLQIDWRDAADRPQRVADDVLAEILGHLGFAADSPQAIDESLARAEAIAAAPPALLCGECDSPLFLPAGWPAGPAELLLEDGRRRVVDIVAVDGRALLPSVDVTGYHRLEAGARAQPMAIAPRRAPALAGLLPGRRPWGASVQIPALRQPFGSDFGDFSALAEAARVLAAGGADAMAISPVHALFPADASHFSPYAPSSRLFLNILLADPSVVGQPPFAAGPDAGAALIDWQSAIPRRMEGLRSVYRQCAPAFLERFRPWRRAAGPMLEQHALFDALHAHFAPSGQWHWRDWPEGFRSPDGIGARAFAAANPGEVEFFAFAQWLAEQSMASAQRAARAAGMGIGLVADLAVGMHDGGSHAWSRPAELLSGLSIGAPPDPLGPLGQNWGITGFSPAGLRQSGYEGFIATLRANLRHAGGIRIDHALGLGRLWIVPQAAPAARGCYLTMPAEDLMRLIALEAERASALVIGEDLGTIPHGFRETLVDKGLLGMRVLWFERDHSGHFIAPERWPPAAIALTGTHDLATLSGWWQGRDLEWDWKVGRRRPPARRDADEAHRAWERDMLWTALQAAGAAEGPAPAADAPAAVVDGAIAFIARTPCALKLVPVEDLLGLAEQPNLPGTIDEHPNWRRRLAAPLAEALASTGPAARMATLRHGAP